MQVKGLLGLASGRGNLNKRNHSHCFQLVLLLKKKQKTQKTVVASCWDKRLYLGCTWSLFGGHLHSWQTSTSLWGQSNRKRPVLHTKVKDDGWAGAAQGKEGRQTVSVVTSWEQQVRDGTESDIYPLRPSQCSAVFLKVWLPNTGVK